MEDDKDLEKEYKEESEPQEPETQEPEVEEPEQAPEAPEVEEKTPVAPEDIGALLRSVYTKQLLDAQKNKDIGPSVGMNADEFMKRYNEAKQKDNNQLIANKIGNAFAQIGAGIGGHGYIKPNTEFINSLYTPNQNVSQLEDEAKQRGELNKEQLNQQLAQIKQSNENRREVRDVGQAMLSQQKQDEQSTRDAKRLDNETKKLGIEAEQMDSQNMERDQRTQLLANQLQTANLALKNDKLRNDPDSTISDAGTEFYAGQLEKLGMPQLADQVRDLSLQQTEDLLGKMNLSNMITQFNAGELRKSLAEDANQTKLDIAQQKQEQAKQKMAKPISDAVAKLDQQLQYTKNNEDFPSFQKQMQDKNGINDLELMYKYMKLIDPKAVLRKDKSTLVMNADAPINKALNLPERISKGVMFSPQQREALINAAKQQLAVNQKAFQEQAAPYITQAQAAGIPLEQIMPSSVGKSSSTESDTVKVISPNGVPGSIPRANLKKALDQGFTEVKDGQ